VRLSRTNRCVLAPVMFNLYLVAITLASRIGFPPDAGVPSIYRLDGSLLNIRRLQQNPWSLMKGSLSFSTTTMPLFQLLTLPLLFRAASMYCHPPTIMLDLMSMLRRPKCCPLLPIMTLVQLLLLCMAIASLRHGSLCSWGVY